MTLEALDATQKKLDTRITKMSKDMGHKLDSMMKMMTKLAENNNIRKNTETEEDLEYYTLDSNGEPRRLSSESINSKGSWDKDGVGELSSRGRSYTAESTSSTRVAPRMSFRPSIDGSGGGNSGGGAAVVPEKSKSMSRIMSPVSIMRKKSGDSTGGSSKKRHSFSDPIATVKMIGMSPKGDNSDRGFGAHVDGADRLRQGSILLSEDDEDSMQSIDDAPSPETLPTKIPSLGLMFAPKISPRRDSPRDAGPGPPRNASPRVVPLNIPVAEHAHSQSAEELSLHLKKQLKGGGGSVEESKVPLGEEDVLMQQASSRTIESDSSVAHSTPKHSPRHSRDHSPVNELNQPQREVNRQKPTPPLKELSPHSNFTPAKKKAIAASDRSPISGPPVELALSAINQSRIDKTRAQSAGRAHREL